MNSMPKKQRVDWKEFAKREICFSRREFAETVEKLLKSKTLSFKPSGNYQLISLRNVNFSPCYPNDDRPQNDSILYFTRQGDAEDYAKLRYRGTNLPVFVQGIKSFKKVDVEIL